MAKRADVVKALDQHEEALARHANVVGLGVVQAADSPADLAVGVYVVKKLPESELPAGALIPKSLSVKVGGRTLTVPTRVIEQGTPAKESL